KNSETKHNYFGDFHSHGWVFRAVFRQDKKGNKLDYYGDKLPEFTPASRIIGANQIPVEVRELYRNYDKKTPAQRADEEKKVAMKRHGVAHHLLDIHMDKGMHCVDCHFVLDNHGNTRLLMEVLGEVKI